MTLSRLAEMLSRKRLLIFDLDGTIVDSTPLHARAYREALAPHGIAVDYSRISGMITEEAIDGLLREADVALSPGDRAALIADKRSRALALIASELTAVDGAVEFVREARPHFRLALCTSASRPSATLALSRIGIEECFDPVVTAGDVRLGKPAPDIFLAALEAHRLPPTAALVFEDAPNGLAAARAARIDAVRILPAAEDGALDANWTMLRAALCELPG
jgi:HAD superfamily hydrolase (TIGR01509 family)